MTETRRGLDLSPKEASTQTPLRSMRDRVSRATDAGEDASLAGDEDWPARSVPVFLPDPTARYAASRILARPRRRGRR